MDNDDIFNFFNFVAISDKGMVRDNNEDSFLAMPEEGCFVVADGMGGCEAGEVASKIVVDSVEEALAQSQTESPGERKYSLQQAIHRAGALVNKYTKDHNFNAMGSTLSAMLLDPWEPSTAYLCHVGDSRIYCYRNTELFQITNDHTVAQALIAKDSNAKIAEHLTHILTRSIGGQALIIPEWDISAVCPNDLFIICSDGLNTMLDDSEIEACLNLDDTLEDIAKKLVDTTKAKGGFDNITIILVKFNSELPKKKDVSTLEQEESDLLLNIAEKRIDYAGE